MLQFDEAFYLSRNPDVAAAVEAGIVASAETHFRQFGFREGRDPSPLFDTSYYLDQYPDVAAAGVNPLDHFNTFGDAEGRNPNPLFDTAYYRQQNPGQVTSGMGPLEHYFKLGTDEHRDPSTGFDTSFYLEDNPDVAASGMNPLEHYLAFGRSEGRLPIRPTDSSDHSNTPVNNTPVSNTSPDITSNGGLATAAVNVAENGTSVTTVTATDSEDDADGNPATVVTYSLTGGADQAAFSIDASSGALTFKSAPDFETPGSADGNNAYEVKVTATDSGGLTDTQTITVSVTNVLETQITNLTLGSNANNRSPSVSSDGKTVVFDSSATNLVDGQTDTNGATRDIFLYDTTAQTTTNLTLGGNSSSDTPSVSPDGKFVVFESNATNLVDGQTDANGYSDIFLHDTTTQTTTNLTHGGNNASYEPSISSDGKIVVFYSDATNLVDGQTDFNGNTDIFLYDTTTQTTTNLTHGGTGRSYDPSVSSDGKTVVFESEATNLVDGETDTNGSARDVFLYDATTQTTTNLTLGGNNNSYAPSVSSDGKTVVFYSLASNLVDGETDSNGYADIFLYDTTTQTTTNLTLGSDGYSFEPSVSSDGKFVAFVSTATNLVDGQTDTNGTTRDIFLYDTTTQTFTNLTLGGNNNSAVTSISSDGKAVVFESNARNLVAGQIDTNGTIVDIFLWELV